MMRDEYAKMRFGPTAKITSKTPSPASDAGTSAPVPSAGAFSDARLERAIEFARRAMLESTSDQSIRYWWAQMSELIGQRSPAQIERMERARGLR